METIKPDSYESLSAQLSEIDPKNLEEAVEIANKIKSLILLSAKGTSRGLDSISTQANALTTVMFNRFKTNDFDDLMEEISAVQKNPTVFKEPEQVEYL